MNTPVILVLFWFLHPGANGITSQPVPSPEICEKLGQQFVAKGVANSRRYECLSEEPPK